MNPTQGEVCQRGTRRYPGDLYTGGSPVRKPFNSDSVLYSIVQAGTAAFLILLVAILHYMY